MILLKDFDHFDVKVWVYNQANRCILKIPTKAQSDISAKDLLVLKSKVMFLSRWR